MIEPPTTPDITDKVEEAWTRWNEARSRASEASKVLKGARDDLASIDSRLAVHLEHRDLVIAEAGVTELRGTFRLARIVLVIGAILTGLGATLYALGLPGAESTEVDVMVFTPGVSAPEDGTPLEMRIVGVVGELSECGSRDLAGVLVGHRGASTEVVVTTPAPADCQGRWLLPAGSWYVTSGNAGEKSTESTTTTTADTTTSTQEVGSSTTDPPTTTTPP